jgi:hypothetical protein
MLAGSTMETYQQGEDTTAGSFGTNCFNCHNTGRLGPSAGFGFFGTPQLGTVEVSHIFDFVGPPPRKRATAAVLCPSLDPRR